MYLFALLLCGVKASLSTPRVCKLNHSSRYLPVLKEAHFAITDSVTAFYKGRHQRTAFQPKNFCASLSCSQVSARVWSRTFGVLNLQSLFLNEANF